MHDATFINKATLLLECGIFTNNNEKAPKKKHSKKMDKSWLITLNGRNLKLSVSAFSAFLSVYNDN